MINYEEKIRELTERVEKLEKAENKKIIKKRIAIAFKIVKLFIIVILLFMAYTYVKPYIDKINSVNEKIDNVDNYFDDKLDGIKNIFQNN